jgi:hypothetical protein
MGRKVDNNRFKRVLLDSHSNQKTGENIKIVLDPNHNDYMVEIYSQNTLRNVMVYDNETQARQYLDFCV